MIFGTVSDDCLICDGRYRTWLKKLGNDKFEAISILLKNKDFSAKSIGESVLISLVKQQEHKDKWKKVNLLQILFCKAKKTVKTTSTVTSSSCSLVIKRKNEREQRKKSL